MKIEEQIYERNTMIWKTGLTLSIPFAHAIPPKVQEHSKLHRNYLHPQCPISTVSIATGDQRNILQHRLIITIILICLSRHHFGDYTFQQISRADLAFLPSISFLPLESQSPDGIEQQVSRIRRTGFTQQFFHKLSASGKEIGEKLDYITD